MLTSRERRIGRDVKPVGVTDLAAMQGQWKAPPARAPVRVWGFCGVMRGSQEWDGISRPESLYRSKSDHQGQAPPAAPLPGNLLSIIQKKPTFS